jgi:hypothetical protein
VGELSRQSLLTWAYPSMAGLPHAWLVLHRSLEMQPRKTLGATQSAHAFCPCHTPLVHGVPPVAGLRRRRWISSSARFSASDFWYLSQHACVLGLYTYVLHCAPLATSMLGSKALHARQQASAVGCRFASPFSTTSPQNSRCGMASQASSGCWVVAGGVGVVAAWVSAAALLVATVAGLVAAEAVAAVPVAATGAVAAAGGGDEEVGGSAPRAMGCDAARGSCCTVRVNLLPLTTTCTCRRASVAPRCHTLTRSTISAQAPSAAICERKDMARVRRAGLGAGRQLGDWFYCKQAGRPKIA